MISADILGERTRLSPEKTALISVPIQDRFTYRTLNERAILCARMWMETCRLESSRVRSLISLIQIINASIL